MYLSGNVRRKYNGFESNAEFMENWKNFPRVEYTWTENHDFGKLETKITKNKIDENTADETLVKMIGAVKNRINMLGMGEKLNEIIVWKKKWETIGKLPSWKEKYCPIKSPIAGGTLTEIGAIYIEGHGNWYKFLELDDDRKYLIIEEGFTWGEFFYNDKKTLGKKGYNLYLYEIFDIDEGIKIIRDKSSGILESR
ncbi:MAG: hypothetical protein IH845_00995 [Nanoarchaeota archaeon]|nr:hypothetical protein [Nanoarchaeota archaeon]